MKTKNGKNIICGTCQKSFYIMPSSNRKFCSFVCARSNKESDLKRVATRKSYNKPWHSIETIAKMKANHKGSTGKHWKLSEETRKRQGERQVGEKNHMWKDGATKKHGYLRRTREYQVWRRSILERDGYKCISCGSQTDLEVDHIKPFAHHIELRFDRNNGRTLCYDCHRQTDTYAGRANRIYSEIQQSVS